MEDNILEQKFSTLDLLKYALPTVLMMIFISVYTSIDGMFVAHFVSEDALASINFVLPIFFTVMALGLMLSTGSNAIIAKELGEQKPEEARQFFTLIYATGVTVGIIISLIVIIFSDQILVLIGSTPSLYEYTKPYMTTLAMFFPCLFLQIFTQNFFITAGRPHFALITCILGGFTNILLDYIFIGKLGFGIVGAALATGLGFCIPGIFGLLFFKFNKQTPLYFTKITMDKQKLLLSCMNGSSEFVSQTSQAISTFLFNLILINLIGEAGVTAITVILYVQMIQSAIYIGYSLGVSPIISYKFGAGEKEQLEHIFKTSLKTICIASAIVITFSIICVDTIVGVFIEPTSDTFALTKNGFLLFSSAYICMGFNIFTSAMFTAFNNGKISAILSLSRTFLFTTTLLVILPNFWGLNGVWLAVPIAEAITIILSITFIKKYYQIYFK
ncbi:MAG: hypothetical protein ATN36_02045 [Epulopiscium sp. Nele67-Bin005]|nr:MAG: hypothetical protein ATN36_02045 [Epulopiscium sp. Nele67-Bin005]